MAVERVTCFLGWDQWVMPPPLWPWHPSAEFLPTGFPSPSVFHTHCIAFVVVCWPICLSHSLYGQGLLPYLLNFRSKSQTYAAWFVNRKYQSNLLGPTLVSARATSTEPLPALPLVSFLTPIPEKTAYFTSSGNETTSGYICDVWEVQRQASSREIAKMNYCLC